MISLPFRLCKYTRAERHLASLYCQFELADLILDQAIPKMYLQ